MRRTQLLAAIGLSTLVSVSGLLNADTLSIAARLNANAVVPTRGMSMKMVESRFGSPGARNTPVGEPPITRWHYDGFSVYFEYNRVLHSVSH